MYTIKRNIKVKSINLDAALPLRLASLATHDHFFFYFFYRTIV